MKSSNGFIELVILMSFLVGALPLLVSLVNLASFNDYEYLEDKSVVSMNSYIDYRSIDTNGDGVVDYEVPERYGSFTIDPSAAVLLPVVNDDFCPTEGRNISYRFNGTNREGFGFIREENAVARRELSITNGWVSKRFIQLSGVIKDVQPWAQSYYPDNKKLYMTWDPYKDVWVIQDNYVYIWEMK